MSRLVTWAVVAALLWGCLAVAVGAATFLVVTMLLVGMGRLAWFCWACRPWGRA